MKRILTGIQCSGNIHLGNILSVIKPTIELSKKNNNTLVFIANLHTFTSKKDPNLINQYLYKAATVWLAMGLDTNKTIFFKQSDIIGICELTWILNCLTPYPMLANAHAFKEKSNNLSDINVGLFNYPVLMASDILLYQTDLVTVGIDQKQHIEIARDLAIKFNNTFNTDLFKIPSELIIENVKLIPGTDGRKMSKSYNNIIDIFAEENELRKEIMSIVTDSKKPEEPKNPDECNIFNIYKNLVDSEELENMRSMYINGGLGYKQAKDTLFELIIDKFKNEREEYNKIKNEIGYIDEILKKGKLKAQEIANKTLKKLKEILYI